MEKSPALDFVKVAEIFLIPSSFLVAALGTADTNPHRAAVSALGLIVGGLWWLCSHDAYCEVTQAERKQHPRRMHIFWWLPAVFVIGWVLSLIAHLVLWAKPLGA